MKTGSMIHSSPTMLILTKQGLYCPAGNFHIDPSGAVENAVLTHAHSDHARRGSRQYYSTNSGLALVQARLGKKISILGFEYGEVFRFGNVRVSFHPAGHILGSAQVRIEHDGQVWVVSGDYKRDFDPTCEPFEVVPCDVFVTEATFGTPAYQWPRSRDLGKEIADWWSVNSERSINSVLFAYSLGKTQRVLGVLAPYAKRPIYTHPSASVLIQCYRDQGIEMAQTLCLSEVGDDEILRGEMILTPPAFLNSDRASLLGDSFVTAFASGWMASTDRRHGYDHGFVMSDHADWDDLVRTVRETGARTVYVQHRGNGALVKHLRQLGIKAHPESDLAVGDPAQLLLF